MKVTGSFKKYLLVSIGLSIGLFLTVSCTASPDTPPATNGEKEPTVYQADRVDMVYFHRTNRCYSCNYAEAATLYALETYFQEELDSDKLTFESVNVQDDSNAAIIEKYGAYTSQLFINTVTGDNENIEHVTEIWNFIGDDEGFTLLIRTKVTNALEGAG